MAPIKRVVAVSGPTANRSAIYRRPESKDGFPDLPGATTLYELFKNSAEKHPQYPCLGQREIKVRPGL